MKRREIEQSRNSPPGIDRIHPAQRTISRRSFFSAAAGASAFALSSGLWRPSHAEADEQDAQRCISPLPIPHVTSPPGAHFFFAGPVTGAAVPSDPTGAHPGGRDPSTITHFKGVIGQADLNFSGTGTDTNTGTTGTFNFHTDTRFMKGVFIGSDERKHHGAFAFI
jgi:hypothetical protein